MILAGDIGGTKTVLALYRANADPAAPAREKTYPSAKYESLERIIEDFFSADTSGRDRVRQACFGVAGPVVGGKASLPNLPWVIESAKLEEQFCLKSALLINDLESIGHSIPVLDSSDVETVKRGDPQPGGNIAVIAPGTGLGETFLSFDGDEHSVHPSEGGHADFAPVNQVQIGLLEYLLRRFDHVSYERVCSGTGLPNIYEYVKDCGVAEEPEWLARELESSEDPNATIIGNATDRKRACPICTLTAETFVSILAAEAGNMVLRCVATGGLYLAGGIPPRILPFLKKKEFQRWFTQKGRLSRLPERVPVSVVLNSRAALIGAASCALLQARKSGMESG